MGFPPEDIAIVLKGDLKVKAPKAVWDRTPRTSVNLIVPTDTSRELETFRFAIMKFFLLSGSTEEEREKYEIISGMISDNNTPVQKTETPVPFDQ